MMRASAPPAARADSTKGCSRSERTSARTKRAGPTQPRRPMTTMMIQMLGVTSARMVSSTKNEGKESCTSTTVV